MATYAVGDLQGCLAPLKNLLAQVNFQPGEDTLWLVGDLVNRGPDSLETLRFVKSLGDNVKVVLGNHDLHLLAIYYGVRPVSKSLLQVIEAPDVDDLMNWLRQQPLVHIDHQLEFVMSHAGILPVWTLDELQGLSDEVSHVLCGKKAKKFFQRMYGNTPHRWRPNLEGMKRLRGIVNAFTRMRFCTASGKLDLDTNDSMVPPSRKYKAWFKFPNPGLQGYRIVFGHWAVLEGRVDVDGVYGLDTGCVWGRCMTMMRLEDGVKFTSNCGGSK